MYRLISSKEMLDKNQTTNDSSIIDGSTSNEIYSKLEKHAQFIFSLFSNPINMCIIIDHLDINYSWLYYNAYVFFTRVQFCLINPDKKSYSSGMYTNPALNHNVRVRSN